MSSRPRFLLTFLAWSSGLSGGDRHLLEVAARWREHVDVAVLAPPEAASLVRSFLGDVQVHELGSAAGRRAAAGPSLAFEYVKRAATVVLRKMPSADVVVAASHFLPDAAGLAAIGRRGTLGVAYVYHLLADRPGLSARTLWSKNDERVGLALLRRFAGVVFVSNTATASLLTSRGFDVVRTAVGVDLASFPHVNPRDLPPRAVFIARMARTKGVMDAIEAWVRVRGSVPEARLVMVGSGPERGPGTALANRLNVSEAVEWRGFVSEDEKRQILGESRLLLAPSYEEGWGIAVCEALASGVPVVAYRHAVLDELFDTAYVGAAPGDVNGLADAAIRVLTDAEYAETLSKRGRRTASQYDVGRVADEELETILRTRCES